MPKFSAVDWKEAVEKDIIELKKFAVMMSNFMNMFEQWRRIPFNPNNGENNETNTRRNQEDERKATSNEDYGSTKSNPKSKKRNSGNVARKSRAKSKKIKR